MKKYFIFSVILFLLIISCATTEISSFVNQDIKISEYSKIMVLVNIKDVELRKTLEKDLVEQFQLKRKNAISSIEIISPLKQYSVEELDKILKESLIDCIVEITMLNASDESKYIPQQTYTNYRSQYVNGQLISVPYTTSSGGYSVSYPKASFEILVSDVASGELAIKATANSEGDEFSDMKTISKSLAKEIVAEFIAQP